MDPIFQISIVAPPRMWTAYCVVKNRPICQFNWRLNSIWPSTIRPPMLSASLYRHPSRCAPTRWSNDLIYSGDGHPPPSSRISFRARSGVPDIGTPVIPSRTRASRIAFITVGLQGKVPPFADAFDAERVRRAGDGAEIAPAAL